MISVFVIYVIYDCDGKIIFFIISFKRRSFFSSIKSGKMKNKVLFPTYFPWDQSFKPSTDNQCTFIIETYDFNVQITISNTCLFSFQRFTQILDQPNLTMHWFNGNGTGFDDIFWFEQVFVTTQHIAVKCETEWNFS